MNGLFGRVVIVDRSGARRACRRAISTCSASRGAATRSGSPRPTSCRCSATRSMRWTPRGAVRLVARVPGNTSLHESRPMAACSSRAPTTAAASPCCARRGGGARPLVARHLRHRRHLARGRRIFFTETGVGGGTALITYVRARTAPAPCPRRGYAKRFRRTAGGRSCAPRSPHLDVIPTGAGQARIERAGLTLIRARSLADGHRWSRSRRRPTAGRGSTCSIERQHDAPGDTREPRGRRRRVGVSPEARTLRCPARGIALFPLAGGARRACPRARTFDASWAGSRAGCSSRTTRRRAAPCARRSRDRPARAWVDIQPRDPAGIMNLDLRTLVVTPDGRGYGYIMASGDERSVSGRRVGLAPTAASGRACGSACGAPSARCRAAAPPPRRSSRSGPAPAGSARARRSRALPAVPPRRAGPGQT